MNEGDIAQLLPSLAGGGGGGAFEIDERVVRGGIGGGDVVGEDGAGRGGALDVHVKTSGFTAEAHIAVGEGGAVEAVVAELSEVIAQQVVGFDIEVVGHVLEVLEADAAVEDAFVRTVVGVVVAVVEADVVEGDGTWTQMHAVASVEVVAGVEDVDAHGKGVQCQVALEIQLSEGTEEVGVACGAPLQVREDTLGEEVDEVGVDVVRKDMQVDASSWLASGFDDAYDMAELAPLGLADESVDIYGAIVLPTEAAVEAEVAQQAPVEREVVHAQHSIHLRYASEIVHLHLARGQSGELHVVEVDDAEDVLQIDVAEVGIEGVLGVRGNASVYLQMTARSGSGVRLPLRQRLTPVRDARSIRCRPR